MSDPIARRAYDDAAEIAVLLARVLVDESPPPPIMVLALASLLRLALATCPAKYRAGVTREAIEIVTDPEPGLSAAAEAAAAELWEPHGHA